jgi:Na+/H+ antiporter NhaD/arsenite permease-like protein
MHSVAVAIFIVSYVGIAIGTIPGLAIDRTGIALLGAIAMIASGVLTTREAINSIDFSTILLLYSLMVISSQFTLGGFYTHIALKIMRIMNNPKRFLFTLMAASAFLSAILTNDVICLAFTPVLAVSLLRAGYNPVPFLIGLAVSSNIGSAATIIGNPQNMLIGQIGQLDFGHFFIWCLPPSILSLFGAFLIITLMYHKKFHGEPPPDVLPEDIWPQFNRHQSTKGIIAGFVLIALFFTGIPREISAILIAGILLCSRSMTTRMILGLVDWHLITLFCALFIIIQGIHSADIFTSLMNIMNDFGITVHEPYTLTGISFILSNLVSNVPATMLLTRFLEQSNHLQWYVLALSSTFAGNLIIIGSIANLITFEQAKQYGIKIGFVEHARVGIPITIYSLIVTFLWIRFAGFG